MSTKSFDALIAAGEGDAALAALLNQARSLAEVVALGAARGFVFGEDEARAGLQRLRARELDEDELEAVVGGAGRKSGEGQKDFLKVTLKEVFITSF